MGSILSERGPHKQDEASQLAITSGQLDNFKRSSTVEKSSTPFPSNLPRAQGTHKREENRKTRRSRSRGGRRSLSKIYRLLRSKLFAIRSKAKNLLATRNVAVSSSREQQRYGDQLFRPMVLLEFETESTSGSIELQAMLDTGCPYNIINPAIIQQHNIIYHKHPRPLHILDTMDNHPIFFSGYVELRWGFRHPEDLHAPERFYESIFYIPQEPQGFQLLVGRDTILEHGILAHHSPTHQLIRPSGYPIFRAKLPTPVKEDELSAAEKAQRTNREAEKALEEQARNQNQSNSASNSSGSAASANQQNG